MLIRLLVLVVCCLSGSSFAQFTEQQVWVETGLKVSLSKKISTGVDLTQRYAYNGLNTIFPQLSIKYKPFKWLKPSIDYRFIGSKELNGTYTLSHRINGNIQIDQPIKRFQAGIRVRYQYSFNRLGGQYDAEFDQAWRIKPSLQYDIKGTALAPSVSAEFFYDPSNSASGHQFTRIRYYAGLSYTINNHALGLGAFCDQWVNSIPRIRIMYNLTYAYSLDLKKKDKPRVKNPRDL
jgi:hypothetical protein